MSVRRPAAALLVLAACITPRAAPYHEACADPANPCTFSYDFEPSGVALDVFAPPEARPRFIVANEDAALFRWSLAPADIWDHDNVELVRGLSDVIWKVESAASRVCGGVPVLLVAANFMPGRSGPSPRRERVVAITGRLDAPPRVLEKTSAVVRQLGALEGADRAKVEGLALSADCRTLYVGLRSVQLKGGGDALREEIYPVSLDIDWAGTGEEASSGAPIVLETPNTCSGRDEGISSLEVLADGTLVVLTSHEVERVAKKAATDVAQGELAGSLWRRRPDGRTQRLACFPGHKPEAVAVMPDERSVRVIAEDDEYGGRPIRAWAVRVDLPLP
jgi:hypothetical protein